MTTFAGRVRAGEALLGALLRMPNEGLVELAGLVGLDYIVLDTEHGPGDQLALSHHIAVAEASGLSVLVRIGAPVEALRVLDLGASGVIAPHVNDAAHARELVAAVHYPPLGTRGFAGYTRAARYGLRPAAEHYAAGRDTVVVAMIEDPDALAVADRIAAVDGVDALMFGPADYSTEIGALGATDDPRVATARAAVRAAARAAGRAGVSIVGSPAAARSAFAAGDTLVMYNVQQAVTDLFGGLAAGRPTPVPRGPANSGRQPLVLLPGMLGDAAVWADTAAALHDVAVPHFGRIDLDDSVAGMAETVLSTAPARFALAGHSLGAIVALEVARRAPERVTRLALVNASGRGPVPAQERAWAALLDRLQDGQFDTVAAELARDTLPAGRRDDPALRAANEQMAARVGPAVLRRQLRAQQGRTSYLDALGALTMPVLVVTGDLDEVCPPQRQQELVEHLPHAERVTLAGTGHMAPLEQPGPLAAALRTWLQS